MAVKPCYANGPWSIGASAQTKSARLAELNAALNMDGRRQPEQQEEDPREDDGESHREPPSILERLKQPGPARTGQPMRKENDREEAI